MLALRYLRPLAVCSAAFLALTPALAATLNATAKDAAGKGVAGVVVTLRDSKGTRVGQQATNDQGVATFANIAPGHYTVQSDRTTATPGPIPVDVIEARAAVIAFVLPIDRLSSLVVTATRLREARIALSPKVGTTVYTLDQELVAEYGAGENTPMNEVLLRLPGVAQDSKASGSLHVRDEHANVQYRINGIQLPEGISGFGQSVDSRFVDRIDFVTGTLPAQYGLRTAGVVDIETKDGTTAEPGGSVGVLVGGHNAFQPSLELVGSKGPLSYYLTGNFVTNTLGIENPTPTTQRHSRSHRSGARASAICRTFSMTTLAWD